MAASRLMKCRCSYVRAQAFHQQAALMEASPEIESSPEEFVRTHASELTPTLVASFIKEQRNPDRAYRLFCMASQQTGYKHDNVVYSAIVHCLCRANQFDLVPALTKAMEAEDFSISPSTITYLLKAMADEGMAQEALAFFQKTHSLGCKPTRSMYHCVVFALVKAGELSQTMQLLAEMEGTGVYPDSLMVGMLSNGLCKAGKVDEAVNFVDSVVKFPGSVDTVTLNGLVGCLCKARRCSDAIQIVEKMKTCCVKPDVATYNKLIAGLCNSGQVDEAVRLLDNMSEDSILPDSATLTIVLKGFCKQGRVDEALLFFEKMGPKVDGHEASYNILVHGLCFKMRIKEALNMASEMCRRGIVLTVHTYTAFVCAYFKMGKVEAACDILLELKKSGINADNTLCVELIIGLCQNNRVDSALALLKQMPECGCTPNQIHYTAVISGLCKANRVPEAMELGHTMIKSRNRPDSITFSPIFEALCTSGKEKEAYELLDVLVENGADLTTGIFSSLIRGLCKARRLDGVRKLMAEMTTRGYHPDAVVYATLINANAHYLPGTVDLFTPLIGSNIVLSAARYADLMGGLFRSGEVEFALKVFKEMQRVGCPTRTESFNVIIDGLCRNNRVQEALEYLQNMKQHGCMPDHITYTILIHYFGMIGEFGRMDSLYKEMRANGCKPDDVTYSVLLQGFSKCERFNELYAVLDDMKTEGFPPNDPALRLLFENLRHKDQKRMTKYLKKEFGVSYELLTSVEADSSVKTKGKSDTKLIKGEDLCKSGKEVKSHCVPNSNKKIDSDDAKGTSTDSEGQCNKVFDSKHSSLTKNLGKSTRKSSKRSEKNMTDSFEKSNELNESVRFQEEKDIFKRSEAFSGRSLNNSGKEYPSPVDSKKSSAVKNSVKPAHRSSNKSKKEKAGSREKSDKLMESGEVPEQSNRKRVSYSRKKDSSKAAKEGNCSKVFKS